MTATKLLYLCLRRYVKTKDSNWDRSSLNLPVNNYIQKQVWSIHRENISDGDLCSCVYEVTNWSQFEQTKSWLQMIIIFPIELFNGFAFQTNTLFMPVDTAWFTAGYDRLKIALILHCWAEGINFGHLQSVSKIRNSIRELASLILILRTNYCRLILWTCIWGSMHQL